MYILALDPATKCGFAIGRMNDATCDSGTWDLSAPASEHAGNKLLRLAAKMEQVIELYKIEKIAFEDASYGSHFAKTQAFHNQIRGVILLVAARFKIPYIAFTPSAIKKFATGSGIAKKDQMMAACKTIFGIDVQGDDNRADALFILEYSRQYYAGTLKVNEAQKKQRAPRNSAAQSKLFHQ